MQKELPAPLIIGAIVVLLAIVGFVLYKGWTGGVQGDGKQGQTLASPFQRPEMQEKMKRAMQSRGVQPGQ